MKKATYSRIVDILEEGYSKTDVCRYIIKNHPTIFLKALGMQPKTYLAEGVVISEGQYKEAMKARQYWEDTGEKVQAIKMCREAIRTSLKWTKEFIEGTEQITEKK